MPTNPMVPQGSLNRVRASVVFPSYPTLNINSSHMSEKFVSVDFDEDFVEQLKTATGLVNSPEPYVETTIAIGILRTQALGYAFIQQAQITAVLGSVHIHSDSSAFPALHIHNCSLLKPAPGPFNGKDPTLDLTIRGIFYPNNSLWNLI